MHPRLCHLSLACAGEQHWLLQGMTCLGEKTKHGNRKEQNGPATGHVAGREIHGEVKGQHLERCLPSCKGKASCFPMVERGNLYLYQCTWPCTSTLSNKPSSRTRITWADNIAIVTSQLCCSHAITEVKTFVSSAEQHFNNPHSAFGISSSTGIFTSQLKLRFFLIQTLRLRSKKGKNRRLHVNILEDTAAQPSSPRESSDGQSQQERGARSRGWQNEPALLLEGQGRLLPSQRGRGQPHQPPRTPRAARAPTGRKHSEQANWGQVKSFLCHDAGAT